MAGIDDKVQITVSLNPGNTQAEIHKIIDGLRGIGSASVDSMRSAGSAVSSLLLPLGEAVAAAVSVRAAFGAMFEGIQKADTRRDLLASVQALSSSAEAGVTAFDRLDKAAEKTRITGDELVKLYGQALPLAMDRGFSETGAQRFIAQIAKLAPAIGQSVEQTIDQAEQILAGRVRKTNLLAHALGLDPDAYSKGLQGLESVFPKIDELAAKGEAMGQTFASAGAKIKDALVDSFADGFNAARGATDSGLGDLLEAFRNPELLGAIHDIGKAIGEWAPIIIGTVAKVLGGLVTLGEGIRAFKDKEFQGSTAAGLDPRYAIDQANMDAKIRASQASRAAYAGADQYTKLFGSQYGATGQVLPKDVFGPAIPSVNEFIGAVKGADAANAHWNATLAGSGEQLKRVREDTGQFDTTAQDAAHAAAEAALAFNKLFTPPETDPLLKAIQDLNFGAGQLDEKLTAQIAKMQAILAKPGIPPEVAAAVRTAISALTDLDTAIPKATAAQREFLEKDFLRQALEKDEAQIKSTTEAFSKYIQTQTEELSKGAPPEALAGITAEFEAIAKARSDAIAQAQTQDIMGISPFTPAVLKKIDDDAALSGKQASDAWHAAFQEANAAFDAQVQAIFDKSAGSTDFVTQMLEIERAFKEDVAQGIFVDPQRLNKAFEDAAKKAADAFQAALNKFGTDFSDLMVAGLTGGAEGFASAAAKQFLSIVSDGGTKIGKLIGGTIASIAFGAPPDRSSFAPGKQGDKDFSIASAKSSQQQAQILGVLSGVVGSIAQTLQIFSDAQKGKAPSVLGTTVSFAAAGASIGSLFPGLGTVIGAAVGAIAGAIVGILATAKAKAAQPYALYGIENGQPYVKAAPGFEKQFANITQQQSNDMLAQMQTTLENTQNDYLKLLLKFPNSVAKSITAATFAPMFDQTKQVTDKWKLFWGAFTGGIWGAIFNSFQVPKKTVDQPGTGDITNPAGDWKKAFANFQSDFANWVNNTLPKSIIANFEEPLAAGFATLGLTAEKFHLIWDRLQAIDPKDAIKSLNDLFDALTAFKEVQAAWSVQQFGITVGLFTQAREDMFRSFADSLAQADVGLVQMGAELEHLVGPEQITQAKAWGDALLQREDAVKQFFQKVAQDIDSVINSYQGQIRDLTLQGMTKTDEAGNVTPDVGAQVGYLKKYADSLWSQITKATTPEQVMQLSQELQKTIGQIQQIGGSQSADAAKAYREWAIKQLNDAQDLVTGQLTKLAHDVEQQNEAFLNAIQGFIDAFLHATEQLGGEVTAPPPGTGDHTGGGGGGGSRGNIDYGMTATVDSKRAEAPGAVIYNMPPPINPRGDYGALTTPLGSMDYTGPKTNDQGLNAPISGGGVPPSVDISTWVSAFSSGLPLMSDRSVFVGAVSEANKGIETLLQTIADLAAGTTPAILDETPSTTIPTQIPIPIPTADDAGGSMPTGADIGRLLDSFRADFTMVRDRAAFVGAVADGNKNIEALLQKISDQQAELKAIREVLEAGRDIRMSVEPLDVVINDESVARLPITDDGGFDRRSVNSRGPL